MKVCFSTGKNLNLTNIIANYQPTEHIGTIVSKKLKPITTYFHDFWKKINQPKPDTWLRIVVRILGIVLVFFLLEKALFRLTTLPFEIYYGEFIYWEFIKKLAYTIYGPVIILLFITIYRKRLFIPWKSFDHGGKLRFFATATSLILTWVFATYDYNYLFDQWYTWDRILLGLLVLLIYWRPIFTILFLSVLLPIIGQIEVLPGASIAAPLLPIRILLLLTVFIFIKMTVKWFKIKDFIFILGCILGTHYFASGLRKIIYGFDWILSDQINYLLPATYANGWLNFASPEWISMATEFLGNFNVPLKLFVLGVECGILFMFFNFKWMRFCLMGAIAMHLGILAYSGIFFWMWSLILLMVLYLFYNKGMLKNHLKFNKGYLAISVILIGFGYLWCRPVSLAWRDVPFSYTYKFRAVTENGKSFLLPPKFFSPYDYQFTLGNFKYLNPQKRLPVVWGSTPLKNGKVFSSLDSAEAIFDFEKKSGITFYNKERAEKFSDFIRDFITNSNEISNDRNFISYIQPPRLLMTFPSKPSPFGNEKIILVEILETTTLYSKTDGFQKIRNERIFELPISK